jgi:hypothetical protein
MRALGEVLADPGAPAPAVPAVRASGREPGRLLANPPALPALSRALEREVSWRSRGADGRWSQVPVGLLRESAEPRARLQRILDARPSMELVGVWLDRIAAGVSLAGVADAEARMLILREAALEQPSLCFTSSSALEAMEAWKFLPTVAEAVEFWRRCARPYRDMLGGLDAVVRDGGSLSEAQALTVEERAAMRAAAAARVAELQAAGSRDGARGAAPRPVYASDEALLAHYQRAAENGPPEARAAAQVRVEQLRAKLGRVS